jgi:hypothetical protein
MEQEVEILQNTANLITLDTHAVIPQGVFGLETMQLKQEIHKAVTLRVLEMLRFEFEQLVEVLYRIDVSEEKAKRAFLHTSEIEIAQELAHLIIEREYQKAEMRVRFSKK